MNSKLTMFLIGISMNSCIYYGWAYGADWAQNISMFLAWVVIALGFLSCFGDAKDMYKDHKVNYLLRGLSILAIGLLVASGSIITGVFYFLVWLALIAKRLAHLDSLKNKDTKA